MSTGKRGRPKLAERARTQLVEAPAVTEALAVRSATDPSGLLARGAHLLMRLGASRGAGAVRATAAGLELSFIRDIHDTHAYRDYAGPLGNGELDGTWETFCKVALRQSRSAIEDRIATLPDLGDELANHLFALGAPKTGFRLLAQAPKEVTDRALAIDDVRELRQFVKELAADAEAARERADVAAQREQEAFDRAATEEKRRRAAEDERRALLEYEPAEGAVARDREEFVWDRAFTQHVNRALLELQDAVKATRTAKEVGKPSAQLRAAWADHLKTLQMRVVKWIDEIEPNSDEF
ncbi:hypothetical protein [Arenimonas sp.]|uniref:hypothetical protein n=1 Tax=Arenimonas sp. TaxID=1872635 RepID=UPI0025BE5619|nr:hypothetical protein [Arenimonas sp.]